MDNTKQSVAKKPFFSLKGFLNDSRSVGILLILCTAISIIITNLPNIGDKYSDFWNISIPFFHKLHLPHSILHLINDLLMAFFFFHVGLEIKREIVVGELSSPRRIIMPLIAALSGVAFPALIFLFFTRDTEFTSGWAIPSATDIAFSLGILSLLGKAVPYTFKVFLTALAIIDDLCAILIIALFYGSQISIYWLIGVFFCMLAVLLAFKVVKNKTISTILYIIFGLIMWYCMFSSGVHSTFAGVLLAILLPVKRIHSYEVKLSIPINFIIIPIFALANTSLLIDSTAISNLLSPLSLGIIFGLLIGKPVGISLSIFIMTKLHIAHIRTKSEWNTFIGVTILAGIGFTMSIFISSLAFGGNKFSEDTAKLSVLLASVLAMIIGYVWLKIATKKYQDSRYNDIRN